MSHKRFLYLLLILPTMLMASCGYKFTADTSTKLAANQRVWVSYFKNITVYPAATVALKRAFFEQFGSQRGILPAASENEGDIVISGKITGYGTHVVSYSAADIAKEYRLTLTSEITATSKKNDGSTETIWQGVLSAWHDYMVTGSIEEQQRNEEAALQAAARKLAQNAIWQMEQNY